MKPFALMFLLMFVLSTASLAASPAKPAAYDIPDAKSYNAHFGNMDPNQDGKVHRQEFEAHFPKADENVFSAIDLNKDGAIDHDEWHAFKAAHGLKHQD